jgi:CheY-like chemotaxis protein
MTDTCTILIAEDDENDALLFQTACEKEQIEHGLRFVQDGQLVIDYLNGKPPFDNRSSFPWPDLLVLDLKMPRLDGFDVLKWVRQSRVLNHMAIVVLSGSSLDKDKDRATELGANKFYVKPAGLDELRQLVRDLCEEWLPQRSAAQQK